jgi:hypothetical protein
LGGILAIGDLPNHFFGFFPCSIDSHGPIGAYRYSAWPPVDAFFQGERLGTPGDPQPESLQGNVSQEDLPAIVRRINGIDQSLRQLDSRCFLVGFIFHFWPPIFHYLQGKGNRLNEMNAA